MADEKKLIDLNSADVETLTTLPGIGPAMAERIVAARPFEKPEDLQKVSGIGRAAVDRVLPLIYASTEESVEKETLIEAPTEEAIVEETTEEAEISPEEMEPIQEIEEEKPEEPEEAVAAEIVEEAEIVPEATEPTPEPEEVIIAAAEEIPPTEIVEEIEPEATEEAILAEIAEEVEIAPEPVEEIPEVVEEAVPAVMLAAATEGEVEGETMMEITPEEIMKPEEVSTEPEQAATEETATFEAERPTTVEPVPPAEPPAAPEVITSGRVFRIALASSILTFIFSVVFTLIFLAALNGGLQYASPTEIVQLQRYMNSIENQSKQMQQELTDLQARVDNVEGFSGRIDANEKKIVKLNEDLGAISKQTDQLNKQMQALTKQVGTVTDQVKQLQETTNRFTYFLQGLRDLLNTTFEPDKK